MKGQTKGRTIKEEETALYSSTLSVCGALFSLFFYFFFVCRDFPYERLCLAAIAVPPKGKCFGCVSESTKRVDLKKIERQVSDGDQHLNFPPRAYL